MEQRLKDRICFLVAVLLVSASLCYWLAFSVNAYYTFHTFSDLAMPAYDMYYHIAYPSVVHGLQYISFAEHLAPDQLLVLPIFYLFQSPLTLLFVQAAVLSLTGLLVFEIARRLVKNSFFGLLLCFAYLLSPMTHSLLIFDYHAEFLLVPFVLLTFYFFMERRRIPMLASLFLLLGALESAAFVAIALGAGLLAYELLYDGKAKKGDRTERRRLAAYIILASLVAMGAYAYGASALSSAYARGLYPGLPPALEVGNFGSQQLSQVASVFGGGVTSNGYVPPAYMIYALILVFAGFGASALFVPEVTLLLLLPWLVESLLLGKVSFFLLWHQYFSYVIGGALVAVILSVLAIRNGTHKFRELGLWGADPLGRIGKTMLTLSLVLFMLSPFFIIVYTPYPAQSYLLESTPGQLRQLGQVDSMLSLIPPGASAAAPISVVSHLAQRSELAPLPPSNALWFVPDYVLVSTNPNITVSPAFRFNYTAFGANILAQGGYYLYARNGTEELYALTNYSDSDVP